MTKSELTALGLPEASIKKFQDIYHRDLHKAAQRIMDGPMRGADEIRNAIAAMLPMIRQSDNLHTLLAQVSYLYYAENRHTERAAASATNTDDGKAEQNETPDSASSVDENMGGCQA